VTNAVGFSQHKFSAEGYVFISGSRSFLIDAVSCGVLPLNFIA
jgi:hypothetical protein